MGPEGGMRCDDDAAEAVRIERVTVALVQPNWRSAPMTTCVGGW